MPLNKHIAAGLVAAYAAASPTNDLATRATVLGDSLVQCSYNATTGAFSGELLWQSGNTLETLAALGIAVGQPYRYVSTFASSFNSTPVVVDHCFDDHQWWLHGWIRVFHATGNQAYLARAAAIHDYISTQGWETTLCGGGVMWCPKPWGGPYKNAITTELFISASASLSGYEAFLGKPEGYYGGWAAKATGWFNASGMVNSQWLVNDGLQVASNGECSNNKGTPWSYNQGCMLDGFALQGGYYLAAAQNIATAAVAALTGSDGSFSEPCGDGCDNDAKIFRGVFVRHLAYMLALPGVNVDPSFRSAMGTFLQKNVELLVGSASCPGNVTSGFGPYGLEWAGPCKVAGVATTSAALDLLVAAISAGVQSAIPVAKQARGTVAGAWPAVGAGACVDATGQQMPSCSAPNISESACYAAADSDHNAVAYDFTTNCDGSTLCRVRTSGGPGACQPGFTFTDGPAKSVTGGDGSALALCAALS